MKEKPVGSGGIQSDSFDLDSFLKENNFFADEKSLNEDKLVQDEPVQIDTLPLQVEAPTVLVGTIPAQEENSLEQAEVPTVQTEVSPTQINTTPLPEKTQLKKAAKPKAKQKEPTPDEARENEAQQEEMILRLNKSQQNEMELKPGEFQQGDVELKPGELQQREAELKSNKSKQDEVKLKPNEFKQGEADPKEKSGKERLFRQETPQEKRGTRKSMDSQKERTSSQAQRPETRKEIPIQASKLSGAKSTIELGSTVSYESLGEELPELPSVSDTEHSHDGFKLKDSDFDFLEKLTADYTEGFGAVGSDKKSRLNPSRSTSYSDKAPAATTAATTTGTVATAATNTASAAAARTAVTSLSAARTGSATGAATRSATAAASGGAAGTGTAGTASGGRPGTAAASTHSSAISRKQGSQKQDRGTAVHPSTEKTASLSTLANPRDYQQARMQDNSYRIRGGGKRHNKRSPVMVIVISVVIIVGMLIAGYFLNDFYLRLTGKKAPETVVRLTQAQTRAAIDAEMPTMLDHMYRSASEVCAAFTELGWNVAYNERRAVESQDQSAVGGEIIRLAPGIPIEILEGYYQSEFNIYDYDELQDSFNGAWVLSISHGNRGSYIQIKYVNFASVSLGDELVHLGEAQQLLGENSVIDAEGIDGYGNCFMQGFIDLNDKIIYWKVIGIEFYDYYRGQDRRKLPDTAVFVKCQIATYDFYGVNQTLLNNYLKQKEEAANNTEQ